MNLLLNVLLQGRVLSFGGAVRLLAGSSVPAVRCHRLHFFCWRLGTESSIEMPTFSFLGVFAINCRRTAMKKKAYL
jgi:hypothetical protein